MEEKKTNHSAFKRIVIGSIIVFIIFVTLILSLRFLVFGNEDDWIKDSNGVYVKHGVPTIIPDEVKAQKDLINAAQQLYNSKKIVGMKFSSQCLGTIGNYAVDIAHVPRTTEDDLPENQCEDFRLGRVMHFIELDKDGNVVRIA